MLTQADEPTEEIRTSARSLWESALDAVPRVGVAIVIVSIGWGIGRGLRWLLRNRFRRSRTPSFANVISKLASWVVVIASALVAIAVTFPSVKPVDLLAGVGFFSIAVGFASQDILENTVAGVLLLFRQPFRSGDQIEVVGQDGTVMEINIRETLNILVFVWSDSRRHESITVLDAEIRAVKARLHRDGIDIPASIIALEATPSLEAALHGDRHPTRAASPRPIADDAGSRR